MVNLNAASVRRADAGATFVEAALAFGVVVLFCLGLADVSRYLFLSQILQSSANRGLTVATYLGGLDSAPKHAGEPDGPFERALAQVAERARQEPRRLFETVGGMAQFLDQGDDAIVKLPYASTDDTELARRAALAAKPIEVVMSAKLRLLSVIFLPPLTVTARAVGYREVEPSSTGGGLLDCAGRPFIPGQPLNCSCPGNLTPDPASGQCCEPCSGIGSSRDPQSCACRCAPGYMLVSGVCVCNVNNQPVACDGDRVLNPVTCQCEPCTAPFSYFNPTSRTCECPPGEVRDGAQCVCDSLVCSGGKVSVRDQNPPHQCLCRCPPGSTWNVQSNTCQCSDSLQTLTPTGCYCPPTCAGGHEPWGPNCSCVCPDGTSDQGDPAQECRCPAHQTWDGTRCVCDLNSCSHGTVPSAFPECTCGCPPPKVGSNQDCHCPNNCGVGTQDPYSCICDCGNRGCPVLGRIRPSDAGADVVVTCTRCEE